MSEAREDLYALAALLADLDRVLHPLLRSQAGTYSTEPNIPPPLPTGGGEDGEPQGARSLSPQARRGVGSSASAPDLHARDPRAREVSSARARASDPAAGQGGLPGPWDRWVESDQAPGRAISDRPGDFASRSSRPPAVAPVAPIARRAPIAPIAPIASTAPIVSTTSTSLTDLRGSTSLTSLAGSPSSTASVAPRSPIAHVVRAREPSVQSESTSDAPSPSLIDESASPVSIPRARNERGEAVRELRSSGARAGETLRVPGLRALPPPREMKARAIRVGEDSSATRAKASFEPREHSRAFDASAPSSSAVEIEPVRVSWPGLPPPSRAGRPGGPGGPGGPGLSAVERRRDRARGRPEPSRIDPLLESESPRARELHRDRDRDPDRVLDRETEVLAVEDAFEPMFEDAGGETIRVRSPRLRGAALRGMPHHGVVIDSVSARRVARVLARRGRSLRR